MKDVPGMCSSSMYSFLSVDGPPDPELVRIRDLIYQVAGIFHPDTKLRLLFDRCARRMKEVKASSLREYFEHLTLRATRQTELIALLNEITIGETCFFRSPPQLDALRQIILPKIMRAKETLPVRRLRVLSAGCSTGEEPYTLSMVVQEELQRARGWNVEILATDLNEHSLARARDATYGAYSTRYVPLHYQQKHFIPAGDELQVHPSVRKCVTFRRLNLSDDADMAFMKGMDLIFCCNVLIYFDCVSKRRVIAHFYRSLLPHGYLFLGQTESLYGVNDQFRLIHLPGATAYVRSDHVQAGGQGS
ncbi:MAG TPA: protein-glutamate O-methyltransferase CheR [Candidatus Binatia bacterium]|nr:protein-glutamate O-methyltransferase CheR [Candidatus Binatia bacterium]